MRKYSGLFPSCYKRKSRVKKRHHVSFAAPSGNTRPKNLPTLVILIGQPRVLLILLADITTSFTVLNCLPTT
jgi:hypothetical protein